MKPISLKHKNRMFEVAHLVKTWSACPIGRQHACVIAAYGKYIVSTGYNGVTYTCPKVEVCGSLNKEVMQGFCHATHAEINAILNTATTICVGKDLVAYVTKRPCDNCIHYLRLNNVKIVYWQERDTENKLVSQGGIYL